MQRLIKFRAWDKRFEKMYYTTDEHTVWMGGKAVSVNGIHGQVLNCDTEFGMQYTGLKDKNGVEIFEGDILRMIGERTRCYTMGFDEGNFDLIDYDNYCHDQGKAMEDSTEWEVIGNIYEHPHLLDHKL